MLIATFRLFILFLTPTLACQAYSVLTHEAIVDSVWETAIQKMLSKRFPEATPEDLELAHAYTYGGCIVQDMGYYPFGSHFFSDLTHYVRSGDFVLALINESQDLNEYAFALGALAHYAADSSGHSIATNAAVPLLYPDLRSRFGKKVTYWDNPLAHLRTEFGFDVLQVAQGRYAPDAYRRFIGFRVSKPLLERAFHETYGLELRDAFGNLDLAIGTFRYTVSSIIPGMTRVAWHLKKDELIRETPGMTRKKFLYNLSHASYRKEFGTGYQKPGFGTLFVAFILRVVPKIGPFRSLSFRNPTPEVEKLYMQSFNATVDSYRALLTQTGSGTLKLPNENLDLGVPEGAQAYIGTILAYDKLVTTLAEHHLDSITPELRTDILNYYATGKIPATVPTKKQAAAATRVKADLELLRAAN